MREQILEILTGINPEIEDIINEDLLESGLFDSFEIINIVMALEDCFHIEIDPELIVPDNFRTVDSMMALIKSIQ